MTAYATEVWRVTCDGCGRIVPAALGGVSGFDTKEKAIAFANTWDLTTDGRHFCPACRAMNRDL